MILILIIKLMKMDERYYEPIFCWINTSRKNGLKKRNECGHHQKWCLNEMIKLLTIKVLGILNFQPMYYQPFVVPPENMTLTLILMSTMGIAMSTMTIVRIWINCVSLKPYRILLRLVRGNVIFVFNVQKQNCVLLVAVNVPTARILQRIKLINTNDLCIQIGFVMILTK